MKEWYKIICEFCNQVYSNRIYSKGVLVEESIKPPKDYQKVREFYGACPSCLKKESGLDKTLKRSIL